MDWWRRECVEARGVRICWWLCVVLYGEFTGGRSRSRLSFEPQLESVLCAVCKMCPSPGCKWEGTIRPASVSFDAIAIRHSNDHNGQEPVRSAFPYRPLG